MKRLLTGLLISLTLASLVWPASYTVTTTARRDAALQVVVAEVNDARAAETPPKRALTAEQYLQAIFENVFDSYVQKVSRAEAVSACTTYKTLSTADQDAVKSKLGGRSPC